MIYATSKLRCNASPTLSWGKRAGQTLGNANYANVSGVLTTAGGLVFTGYTDGTFATYDDATLAQVWKINVGTGFNAPPMTFEAGGKQYVAILSGLSNISKGRNVLSPELHDLRNQTMLFVFGL
jgi:alcohol dehydrogenase (cytochrome c)